MPKGREAANQTKRKATPGVAFCISDRRIDTLCQRYNN